MDNGIMPVMNVGSGADGFGFGGGGLWLFAILALMWGGNGGLFGGNGANNSNAIQNDINRGFDNQNLQAQTRDILSAVTGGTAQAIAASTANATNAINAIKDGNAALIREFGEVETALTALSGKQQECCCNILRAIDGVNYNQAMNTAAINANITEKVQKIYDLIQQNTIDALRGRVNSLELNQAVAGVVRYPTSTTYSVPSPCFNGAMAGI
jgi:hypothetical protein